MEKEVTTRMNRVMELVVIENCKTLKEVADRMKISLRQLRYDISQINQLSKEETPLIETNNKGTIIVNNSTLLKKIISKQEKKFKCSLKQRIEYINVIAAFDAKKLNLNNLAKELNVTRVTVKNDLNEVKEKLEKYHLELEYDNYFYLAGNEEDIFEFRLDALQLIEYTLYKEKFEKIEILMQNAVSQTCPDIKLRDILPILSSFVKENNIFVKDSEFYWLAITVFLMLWYNYNDYPIPSERHLNVIMVDFKYDNLFIALEDFMKIELTDSDKKKISAVISTVCNQKIQDIENINIKIIEFIYYLINSFTSGYREIFINDEVLMMGLYNHLERCWKKNTAELEIDIKEEYKNYLSDDLNMMIDDFCENNKHLVELENHQERELLKLHFANSIQHRYKTIKKKAIIISGVSNLAKSQLKSSLESLFELEIIDMISRYDVPFYNRWDNLDIILFTEDIPAYFNQTIPTAKINIILDGNDFIELNKLGIILKEQSLDLYELYKQLDFLEKENQLAVIKVINKYFQNKGRLINHKIRYNINYQVKQVENIQAEDYFELNDTIKVAFNLSNYNLIEYMCDYDNHQIVIKLHGITPVDVIFLLFNCSERLSYIDISETDDEKIRTLLES